MAWCPRQIPRSGMPEPAHPRAASMLIPASAGAQGPGDHYSGRAAVSDLAGGDLVVADDLDGAPG